MGTRCIDHLNALDQIDAIEQSDRGDAILVEHSWAGSYRLQEANWYVELEPPTFRQTLTRLVLIAPWVLQREVLFWKLRGSAAVGSPGRWSASCWVPVLQGVLLAVSMRGPSYDVHTIEQEVSDTAHELAHGSTSSSRSPNTHAGPQSAV